MSMSLLWGHKVDLLSFPKTEEINKACLLHQLVLLWLPLVEEAQLERACSIQALGVHHLEYLWIIRYWWLFVPFNCMLIFYLSKKKFNLKLTVHSYGILIQGIRSRSCSVGMKLNNCGLKNSLLVPFGNRSLSFLCWAVWFKLGNLYEHLYPRKLCTPWHRYLNTHRFTVLLVLYFTMLVFWQID